MCSTGDQSSENHIEGLEVISGCGPVGMEHCTSIGVVWGISECSPLCEFWRRDLEGIIGCGNEGIINWVRS